MTMANKRKTASRKRLRAATWLAFAGGAALLVFGAARGFADDNAAKAAAPAVQEAAPPTPAQSLFFESKIRPLLIEKCYSCHSGKDFQGGIKLDARADLLKGNASGPAVAPGEPEKSSLIRAVHYTGKVQMPPGGKLKPLEIAALTEWVKMGAPWPSTQGNKEPGTGNSKPTNSTDRVTPEQKQFWAFQPVRKPSLPVVKNMAWAKNGIDRLILAKLEAKGLAPAPPASRRDLIRRAYFDLVGLPPKPEEVEAFVADKSPNAFAKVVDRLLASPHYGERWGRHWLDLARYADSNGLDENKAFAYAFRYRDWVVNALNKDKPYNDFLTEQLAGDLLPTTDPNLRNERLTATGFLTLGPKVLAEQDKPKLVMDIIDEQIEVTSKAFMGLTVACARCHNHKFDPIPTKDYYALAGIFKSTRTMKNLGFVSDWMERPLTTPELEKQVAAHEAAMKALSTNRMAAIEAANAEFVRSLHRDTGKYLLAGWELAQSPAQEMESLADTPARPGDPARLLIEAEKFDRGNALRNFDDYGKGIGVIHTGNPPTWAEWDITVPTSGNYQVELRYAAQEARPVRLLIDGKIVKDNAAGQITGSWFPEGQKWEPQGVYEMQAGKHTLRIESDGTIPHIDKLFLMPRPNIPTLPGRKPGRTADAIAKERGLNVEVIKNVARLLRPLKNSDTLRGMFAGDDGNAVAFASKAEALSKQLAASPSDADSAAVLKMVNDPKGVFALPDKPERFYTDAAKAAIKAADDAIATAKKNAPQIPIVMAVEDDKPENVRVHVRGSTLDLGDEVPRHFLTVAANGDQARIETSHSGRLELAQWLTRPEHPLTSRVEVNRIWQGHFGEGIVRTADNFGKMGERPSNPELLDWLASAFVEQGWSVKKMHRMIMLSNTYQMSSQDNAKAQLVDPDNRLLWRINRRRLEAEPFRDSLLAVSGRLDPTLGGSLLSTPDNDYVTNDQSGNGANYNAPRRSLYLPLIRNALFDMFQAFDVGDPSMVNARRATTTVASQALYVMNSPFVLEQAKAFADALLSLPNADDAKRIQTAYRKAYGRLPTAPESARAVAFLKRYDVSLASTNPDAAKRRVKTWQGLCQILFASNEFIYLN